MVIHSDTEKVKEARKFVLTLIFSERNHFCPFCQVSGGDCELQNAAYREGMTHWPLMTQLANLCSDASHPNLYWITTAVFSAVAVFGLAVNWSAITPWASRSAAPKVSWWLTWALP